MAQFELPVERWDGESFGEYVSKVRRLKRDSQRRLADVLGVSSVTIVSRLENNTALPTDEQTVPMARYLGVPVKRLHDMVEQQRLRNAEARLEDELSEVRTRLTRFE